VKLLRTRTAKPSPSDPPAAGPPAAKHAAAAKPATAAKGTAAKPVAAKLGTAKPATAAKAPAPKPITVQSLTEGQRAYEAKRAAKAGMSLEKWLSSKQREKQAEAKARLKAVEATKPPKPPGFFSRLLERAHKPLGS
jgi:hypothetical protein